MGQNEETGWKPQNWPIKWSVIKNIVSKKKPTKISNASLRPPSEHTLDLFTVVSKLMASFLQTNRRVDCVKFNRITVSIFFKSKERTHS